MTQPDPVRPAADESGPAVLGPVVDDQTRCAHWSGPTDVVAIRFACCDTFYPCLSCHAETAVHPARRWPRDAWDTPAVLCGVCRTELTVATYLGLDADAPACPQCGAAFNPGCARHRHHYFEV
ncbi:putative CHY-type Zn-finger protein [Friedmanniella endophytica]|uniref:Putative CHY-type Zn-finger protein n=1 Tax=Microlunatus kandeliicorticis TaxID=1759536 RepID=A0A7W3P681_9ACTN|nr:CHY zinc finger protein [Microlunatus kandeliicorticis]MBA8794684.1 putative CHY-type Zn-finger protein [Microlunatus kandeliicorticis]